MEGEEMGRYFNDVGEPLMTASQARFEDQLDYEAQFEPMDPQDYADRYGCQDAMWEDLYEQQEDGYCPGCGEEGCDLRIRYDREQRVVYHT
jgi:hypothetical protein